MILFNTLLIQKARRNDGGQIGTGRWPVVGSSAATRATESFGGRGRSGQRLRGNTFTGQESIRGLISAVDFGLARFA
jgi:hypothetical protein